MTELSAREEAVMRLTAIETMARVARETIECRRLPDDVRIIDDEVDVEIGEVYAVPTETGPGDATATLRVIWRPASVIDAPRRELSLRELPRGGSLIGIAVAHYIDVAQAERANDDDDDDDERTRS